MHKEFQKEMKISKDQGQDTHADWQEPRQQRLLLSPWQILLFPAEAEGACQVGGCVKPPDSACALHPTEWRSPSSA